MFLYRGGYSQTWAWYVGSVVMTPVLGFSIWLGPFLYFNNQIDPLFRRKIGLSLSHLEILGPTIGLMFHQNVLFNIF